MSHQRRSEGLWGFIRFTHEKINIFGHISKAAASIRDHKCEQILLPPGRIITSSCRVQLLSSRETPAGQHGNNKQSVQTAGEHNKVLTEAVIGNKEGNKIVLKKIKKGLK